MPALPNEATGSPESASSATSWNPGVMVKMRLPSPRRLPRQ